MIILEQSLNPFSPLFDFVSVDQASGNKKQSLKLLTVFLPLHGNNYVK